MKRSIFFYITIFVLMVMHASSICVCAENVKPKWVASYFSGEKVQNGDYEGIAFLEIKGSMPTMQELAIVESHAKQVLASRYKAIVQSRTIECMSDCNGETSQQATYDGIAESSLKITIAMPVFWHDIENNIIWAKVSIPRNKVDAWIEDAPILSMTKKVTQVHGIIYRFVRNEAWIKLEDGRALRFKTDEFISVGDRVVVAYDGDRAKEVYCNSVKLNGSIFYNASR